MLTGTEWRYRVVMKDGTEHEGLTPEETLQLISEGNASEWADVTLMKWEEL